MRIIEYLIKEDKTVTTDLLYKLIIIEKQLRVETFYPYTIESDQEIKKYIQNTKNHFYYLLAEEENIFLGCLKVEINIYDGNKDILYLEMNVVKNYRRKGIATELIKYLVNNITYDYTTIEFHIRSDLEETLEHFLISIGSDLVYTARRSASNLKTFNLPDICMKTKELESKAKINGVSFIFIKNGFIDKNVPFIFEEFVNLVEKIKNSIPREHRENNPIVLTSEQLKERYEVVKGSTQEYYTWIAYDSLTKRPIAFTESKYNSDRPDIVSQEETGVISEYRGKKLGLTLKYKMLEFLLMSEKTKNAIYWNTSNAQSNKYMIAINNEFEFKENGIFNVYYLSKDKILKYLNSK